MGEVPEWYELIEAARYLIVPPWELAEQSVVWVRWAIAAKYAHESARSHQIGSDSEGSAFS